MDSRVGMTVEVLFLSFITAHGLAVRQTPALQQQSAHGGYPSPSILDAGSYRFYTGDGSTAAGWPAMTDWLDFATMWETNETMMNSSCSMKSASIADNSPTETAELLDAITSAAASTGVDQRFILAVIMQESNGCVRVASTISPESQIQNPGLMQTHNGNGTCNTEGTLQIPCPGSEISQMVVDGTAGTTSGDGLQQCFSQANSTGGEAAQYYRAARMYNSGTVDASGDLGAACCTHCYASDIANRLRGWVDAPSLCTLDDDDDEDGDGDGDGDGEYGNTSSPTTADSAATTTALGTSDGEWTTTAIAAVATDTYNTGQWSASESDDGQWSQWASQ